MNDNTAKLLQELSDKLGTTTEYLWSALLRQAYISSIMDIIYFAITIILWVAFYKLYKKKKDDLYDKYDFLNIGGIIMFIFFVFFLVFTIFQVFGLSDCITGFFNPEYWALDKILDTLKSHR